MYTIVLCLGFVLAESKIFLDRTSNPFVIYTSGCIIPSFPLISERIKEFVGIPKEMVNCSKSIPLLNSNATHIWVIDDALLFYGAVENDYFNCCYMSIIANRFLEDISYGNCIQFSTIIKAQHEFVRVQCFYFDNKMYDDFFAFAKVKKSVPFKDPDKFNVIILGLESISRMNFLRTMPKTAQFLRKRGSVQLFGYNKVGDNSFPNLFPILQGISFQDALKNCIHNKNIIDPSACTYIWDNFKSSGYVTALGSDSPAGLLGAYEYNFRKIPADYYLQPFMYETRELFDNKKYNFHLCARHKFYHQILLDYIYDLTDNLKDNNLFGIFWEESVSHENLNYPHIMDTQYKTILQRFEKSGYLRESIIIFLSDHGMRWGDIVQTEQGRLEERLPLLEILFPSKFKSRYKLAYQNFKRNSKRLTTPYDLYLTLKDLINPYVLDNRFIIKRTQDETYKSMSSLFLPVSVNRTCEVVGISAHWCTCYKGQILPVGHKIRTLAAQYLITHINALISRFPMCHKLTLKTILDVSVSKDQRGSLFRVVVETYPGAGIFDSTLQRERKVWAVSGTVSRLNLYGNQSSCVEFNPVKLFCYCKDFKDVINASS